MTTRSRATSPHAPPTGGAKDVREEDAFDVTAVANWLTEHAPASMREDIAGTPHVRQFSGGTSNLTYLLSYPHRELILRRPPHGTKAASAHDMAREFGSPCAISTGVVWGSSAGRAASEAPLWLPRRECG